MFEFCDKEYGQQMQIDSIQSYSMAQYEKQAEQEMFEIYFLDQYIFLSR